MEAKASRGDCDRMVQEASRPNETEKMLKDCAEAATEELSRKRKKKIEFSEVREKNELLETQRNKKSGRSDRRKTRKTMS